MPKGDVTLQRSMVMPPALSRRRFLASGVAGATLLARAPAVLGQQPRELNVWHTEVEPQTVKVIQIVGTVKDTAASGLTLRTK